MDYKYHFVTTSGTSVHIMPTYSGYIPNMDAVQNSFVVATSTGSPTKINVIFPTPPIITDALKKEAGISFDSAREELAILSLLSEIDNSPNLFQEKKTSYEIFADVPNLLRNIHRDKISDRDMRRYVVRKVYDHYSRTTLTDPLSFGQMDFWITGAEEVDFLRNIEVLAEEGYLRIFDKQLKLTGTAKLVREFEKYGAAREDAIAQKDYEAILKNYAVLDAYAAQLRLEYRRYTSAINPHELVSVFRAVAPLVENLLRELLKTRGSSKEFTSIGPMISELQQRNLGSVGLYSQLNHILKFSRDLAEHGITVSEPVLRIACENAFELVPQIASLFP